jgi:hypothetical protein
MIYILVLIWKLPKFSTLTTHTHTFFLKEGRSTAISFKKEQTYKLHDKKKEDYIGKKTKLKKHGHWKKINKAQEARTRLT